MPRKLIGERPMTPPERQSRYRAARTAGTPIVRTRRPADHRSRARRWHDAVAELLELQVQYATWLDALPDNLRDSVTAQALQTICDLDLDELLAIEPSPFPDPLASRVQTALRRIGRPPPNGRNAALRPKKP